MALIIDRGNGVGPGIQNGQRIKMTVNGVYSAQAPNENVLEFTAAVLGKLSLSFVGKYYAVDLVTSPGRGLAGERRN